MAGRKTEGGDVSLVASGLVAVILVSNGVGFSIFRYFLALLADRADVSGKTLVVMKKELVSLFIDHVRWY